MRNEFSGVGPTVGLIGYKPLPCRNFSLFYNVRGSILWDNGAVNEVQTRANYLGGGASGDYARTQADASMFIGEIQVGTQWNFELCRAVQTPLSAWPWSTNTGPRAIQVLSNPIPMLRTTDILIIMAMPLQVQVKPPLV